MPKTHDRYVNNELLGFISRPQYECSCSLSSLTAVFNYLFAGELGIQTSKDLAAKAGIIAPQDIGDGPGNQTVMEWFDLICKAYGVKGNGGFFLRAKDVGDWDKNREVIDSLKEVVHSRDQALIYHMDNHYNVIIGWFEHAEAADNAYAEGELQRWIVLGEHSDYNPIPELIQKALRALPDKILSEDRYNLVMERVAATPIWCRRWGSIRHDLLNTPRHCVMSFRRDG